MDHPDDMQARINELEHEVDSLNDQLSTAAEELAAANAKHEALAAIAGSTRDLLRAAAEMIEKADI